MKIFRVKDKVRLKDYTLYNDYKRHKNQFAIISDVNNYDEDLPISIRWSDGMESIASADNLTHKQREWDDGENHEETF